jgi:recombinational DNA repair protein (RecF pathway)
MHTLHTTDAFILSSIPHGESNRVFRLFTRDRGLLYAHAQSVRELTNRNRFALRSGALVSVTLVRGRETWRITGARELHAAPTLSVDARVRRRKVLDLAGRLLPQEDPAASLFSIVERGLEALNDLPALHAPAVETVTVLRVLRERGYVARTATAVLPLDHSLFSSTEFPQMLLEQVSIHRRSLVARVNSALLEARS